ncbi:MAG: Uma2 family endonuclease [Acidobacteriota bacterium]
MAVQAEQNISIEEYLAAERQSEIKSEYWNGRMVAMSGASRSHNLIVVNIASELRMQLKGRDCEVYAGDMRLRIPSTNFYTYPDVIVVCGQPELEDSEMDTLLNPTLLVEVLSRSTEDYDRGRKSAYYRSLESLSEYLLVPQDQRPVEQYLRQASDRWMLTQIDDRQAALHLSSIECELSLQEVYDKVPASS